jgi:hypothetical protein
MTYLTFVIGQPLQDYSMLETGQSHGSIGCAGQLSSFWHLFWLASASGTQWLVKS